jgi:hypothetical protein
VVAILCGAAKNSLRGTAGKEGKLEKESAEYKKEKDCLTFRSQNGERGRCSVFLLKYFYITRH